jgi:hypothetical protein
MPKDPVTNKYGAKIVHKGVELTWNAETKSILNANDASDFFVESAAAAKQFEERIQAKPSRWPLAGFVLVVVIAVALATCRTHRAGCDEPWSSDGWEQDRDYKSWRSD